MSFPGESPVARWKGKRRSQAPATENMPGRRKSRAIRARCALPGFLPVGQTCLSSFLRLPRISRRFFLEKTWPGFFPGGFFIRRAPATSESVASQCRGGCVFPALALCRRQRCPTERKRVLLRRTFLRAFVNGREMCRSPGAASSLSVAFLGPVRRSEAQKAVLPGVGHPSLLRRAAGRSTPEKVDIWGLYLKFSHDGGHRKHQERMSRPCCGENNLLPKRAGQVFRLREKNFF